MFRWGITLLLLCGVVKAEVCEQCVLDQIDLPGYDMLKYAKELADLEACVTLCFETENCVAVSFVTWHTEWVKGMLCHLKNFSPEPVNRGRDRMTIQSVEMQCVLQSGEKQGVGT